MGALKEARSRELWAMSTEEEGLRAGPAALLWGRWLHLWVCSLVNSSQVSSSGRWETGSALPLAPHLQASHVTSFHCAQRDGLPPTWRALLWSEVSVPAETAKASRD